MKSYIIFIVILLSMAAVMIAAEANLPAMLPQDNSYVQQLHDAVSQANVILDQMRNDYFFVERIALLVKLSMFGFLGVGVCLSLTIFYPRIYRMGQKK